MLIMIKQYEPYCRSIHEIKILKTSQMYETTFFVVSAFLSDLHFVLNILFCD